MNEFLFFIFVFVFGAWSGITFFIWQMSKTEYKTINEYIKFNYPSLYKKWYRNNE